MKGLWKWIKKQAEREAMIWRYFLFVPMSVKLRHVSFKTAKFILIRVFMITVLFQVLSYLAMVNPVMAGMSDMTFLIIIIILAIFFNVIAWKMRYTVGKTLKYVLIIVGLMLLNLSTLIMYATMLGISLNLFS